MYSAIQVSPLGDRIATKIYMERGGRVVEDVTLSMAAAEHSFSLEGSEPKRSTRQDRQKLWPQGGGR